MNTDTGDLAPSRQPGNEVVIRTCGALSGCAAIVYEVMYGAALQVFLGATVNIIIATLATFLAGIAIGALISRRLIYWLWLTELLLGAYAVCFATLLLVDPRLLIGLASMLPLSFAPRTLAAVIMMAPAALLVGLSVPGFTYWLSAIERHHTSGAFSIIYSGYHLIAAACALGAVYWAMPHFGNAQTMMAVGAINMAVGLAIFRYRKSCRDKAATPYSVLRDLREFATLLVPILLAGFLSGMAQDAFIITLNVMFGPLIQNLALAIALSMIGMGLAPLLLAAARVNTRQDGSYIWPYVLLLCGFSLALTLIFAPWMTQHIGPIKSYFGVGPDTTIIPGIGLGFVLYLAIGALIPAFYKAKPLAEKIDRTGLIIGVAALGNVAGYLTFMLVSSLGLPDTVTIGLIVSAFLLLALTQIGPVKGGESGGIATSHTIVVMIAMAGFGLLLAFAHSFSQPYTAILQARRTHYKPEHTAHFYYGIQRDNVIWSRLGGHQRWHYVLNGYRTLTRFGHSMPVSEAFVGALPAWYSEGHRSALVVGAGSGTSATGAATYYRKVDVVDIDPEAPRLLRYFGDMNDHVDRKKWVHLHENGGLSYLWSTHRKYDAIVTTPTSISYLGAYALYTRAYFRAARRHLKKGGVVTIWFGGRLSVQGVKILMRTMHSVFPYMRLVPLRRAYYELVGSMAPLHVERHVHPAHASKQVRNALAVEQLKSNIVKALHMHAISVGRSIQRREIKPPIQAQGPVSTLNKPLLYERSFIQIIPGDNAQKAKLKQTIHYCVGLLEKSGKYPHLAAELHYINTHPLKIP